MTEATSVPDPRVMGIVSNCMIALQKEFPFLQAIPARPGNDHWEIIGYHATGLCIAVVCRVNHDCIDVPAYGESLNAFMERHIQKTEGKCIKGHHWEVMNKQNAKDRDGLVQPGGVMDVTHYTNGVNELMPLVTLIHGLTATCVDRDDYLDDRDVVHVYGVRERPSTVTVNEVFDDDDVAMNEVEEWLGDTTAVGQWYKYPTVAVEDDKMEF